MCLRNEPEEVEKFKKKHKNHKTVTVYKRMETYKLEDDGIDYKEVPALVSPYKYSEYKPGWKKSTSKRKKASDKTENIKQGIHVYLKMKDAISDLESDEVVVKFTANVKDIIGVENDIYAPTGGTPFLTAVFKSVYLSKNEYERHIHE